MKSQVDRRVESDISKAIKEFSKQLSTQLEPIQTSLEQQQQRTEELLQRQKVTADIANLIIGGGVMALFVGLLLNVLPDIFSTLSETVGSPGEVFKIGILSLMALTICSLLVNVIVRLGAQSVWNLKARWTNGKKGKHVESENVPGPSDHSEYENSPGQPQSS